ncbi:hypothetical protein [Halalkalibaculum sp. DA384]|uniref:hypothetical protein n=1 Tax=Halalkalibaculum sp. DA384 TaxID=3373606 RepID=UPI003754DFF9
MSRFYPPSGGNTLGFDLYVVSAMIKDGSLLVSWSSGEPATEQIDYGIEDDTVPNQTSIPIDDQGQRIYTIMHEVYFPQTYVDTTHYFRVRSQNRAGKELVSPVYSVYVTSKLATSSEGARLQAAIQQVQPTKSSFATVSGPSSDPHANATPEGSAEVTLVHDATKPLIPTGGTANQTTTFETNINTTVA